MTSARRVTLVASGPKNEILDFEFPSYGVRRIEAALREEAAVDVTVVEETEQSAERALAAILASEPDVVAFSTYLWSIGQHVRLARELKSQRPECRLVMGGPCAHPALFALEPYADGHELFDALVLAEGERSFVELLRPGVDPSSVPGLALPRARASLLQSELRFSNTAKRPPAASRDEIASPYQRGLVPRGGIAYLQRYYGCPLTCTYCEWGLADDARNVHSREYLTRELEAFGEAECTGAMVVDAGLNMNARAFEHLRDAERDVGFLRGKPFFAEVYPSQVTSDTLSMLEHIGDAHVGVGLQSYDPEVLARLERSFEPARFERVVSDLASVCSVSIEIILGLPGDDPESFRRTLERARELPASVRVYPCVVLPTGLMTRSPERFALRFDPRTLKVDSCWGWTEDAMRETSEWLTSQAAGRGVAFDYWWGLPGPEHREPVRASA